VRTRRTAGTEGAGRKRARTDGRERPDEHDVAPGWREDMTVPVAIRELLAAQPWWRPSGHDGASASLPDAEGRSAGSKRRPRAGARRMRRGDRRATKRRPRAGAWRMRRGDRRATKRRPRARAGRTRRGSAGGKATRVALRRAEPHDEPAPTRPIRGSADAHEFFDHDFFRLTGISGHTLKHLASAVGVWWV
jgi:hypothetical protein